MASLTIRDVPDAVLDKIRILSQRERRSLNKEFLVIVEEGLATHIAGKEQAAERPVPPDLQTALWKDVAGKWKDNRATGKITDEIRRGRSMGREVRL